VSTQQKAVLRVVRNLAAFNGVVITLHADTKRADGYNRPAHAGI
jgi:hypothetical protein